MLSKSIIAEIQGHSEGEYPNEACGLIVSVSGVSVAVKCNNASVDKLNTFVIDPKSYMGAREIGEIIGVWHSHVEIPATASDADRVGCESSELPWYIVSIWKGEEGFHFGPMDVVEPCGFELDYVGRPYVWGVLDCFSLVRDYYRRELGIHIADYPRVEDFWKKNLDFFGDNWKSEGFIQMIDQQAIKGDVFIIQTSEDIPNHVAVYIGDETILHHCHGRLSGRGIYGGYWKKHTIYHLRHSSKC